MINPKMPSGSVSEGRVVRHLWTAEKTAQNDRSARFWRPSVPALDKYSQPQQLSSELKVDIREAWGSFGLCISPEDTQLLLGFEGKVIWPPEALSLSRSPVYWSFNGSVASG